MVLYILLIITIVLLILYFYIVNKEIEEQFRDSIANYKETETEQENNKLTGFRECSVYHTDNIKDCDDGVYDYSIQYYNILVNKLKDSIDSVIGPTKEQNILLNKYYKIIAEYKSLISKGVPKCKTSFKDWKQYKEKGDKATIPVLGDINPNSNNGSPSNWAFCSKNSDKLTDIEMNTFEQNTFNIDGVPSIRMIFDSFATDNVKNLYCLNADLNKPVNPDFLIALTVDDHNKYTSIEFISNNKLNAEYFLRFFTEEIRNNNSIETLSMIPAYTSCEIVVAEIDLCNTVTYKPVNTIDIRFKKPIAVKSIENTSTNKDIKGSYTSLGKQLALLTDARDLYKTDFDYSKEDLANNIDKKTSLINIQKSLATRIANMNSGKNENIESIINEDGSAEILKSSDILAGKITAINKLIATNEKLIKKQIIIIDKLNQTVSSKKTKYETMQKKVTVIEDRIKLMNDTFIKGVEDQLESSSFEIKTAIDPVYISYDNRIYIKI